MERITNQHDLKVGDKFIFTKVGRNWAGVSANREYTVAGQDEDDDCLYFYDDDGERNYVLAFIGETDCHGVVYRVREDGELTTEVISNDYGKHYRHSFRLNLTLEDAANGYVTVNLDDNPSVSSPEHYQLIDGFEVKDLMRILLGRIEESKVVEFTHFQSSCYKEAVQYLLRFMRKNGIEDIEKAVHYLEQVLEDHHNNG